MPLIVRKGPGHEKRLSAGSPRRLWTAHLRKPEERRASLRNLASFRPEMEIVQISVGRWICGFANRLSCRCAFRFGIMALASDGGPREGCWPLRGATGGRIAGLGRLVKCGASPPPSPPRASPAEGPGGGITSSCRLVSPSSSRRCGGFPGRTTRRQDDETTRNRASPAEGTGGAIPSSCRPVSPSSSVSRCHVVSSEKFRLILLRGFHSIRYRNTRVLACLRPASPPPRPSRSPAR